MSIVIGRTNVQKQIIDAIEIELSYNSKGANALSFLLIFFRAYIRIDFSNVFL